MRRFRTLVGIVGLCASVGCFGDVTDPPTDASTCPYHVYRHNPDGWLITHPVVNFVFWGDYWTTATGNQQAYTYEAIWSSLFSTTELYTPVAEYGINTPVLNSNLYFGDVNIPTEETDAGGSFVVYDDTSANVSAALNSAIQQGQLPVPDSTTATTSSTIYVVFLPPNATTQLMLTYGDDGYHSTTSYGTLKYSYAFITYGSTDYTDSIVSHELYEASSDPASQGYWDDATSEEIADLCDWVETTVNGYVVQKVWSQDTCQCQ